MTAPIRWSEVVWKVRQHLIEKPRSRALAPEELAARVFGEEDVDEIPALIDAAALTVAAGPRLVVHQIRPAVAQLVDETDIHSLPAESPRLIRRPFMVEARRPETGERLFGDVVFVGGYPGEGGINMFWSSYPDGDGQVVRWEPTWGEGELPSGVPAATTSPILGDPGTTAVMLGSARDAARFLVVLGLLLDAEAAPLRVDDERLGEQRPSRPKGRPCEDSQPPVWITRHLYLDDRRRAVGQAGGSSNGTEAPGRFLESVEVRGHLKRQRHGPGNTKVRWIYVASYEARRWVAPRATRVVLNAR